MIRQSNTRPSPSRLRSRNSQRSTDRIASCFNIFTREKYHYCHPIHICLGYPLNRTTCIRCTGTTVQYVRTNYGHSSHQRRHRWTEQSHWPVLSTFDSKNHLLHAQSQYEVLSEASCQIKKMVHYDLALNCGNDSPAWGIH